MRKAAGLTVMLVLLACVPARGQADSVAMLRGRVTAGGAAVPYATLQLAGTSVGVSCNDAGEYELKLLPSQLGDTVMVRSVGYREARVVARRLLRQGGVRLQPQPVELREVSVTGYSDGRRLVGDAVARIKDNYQQRTTHGTFFYRDWRAVDGELYLFDEAVMLVRRAPYSAYADRRGYAFNPTKREMDSNIKRLLRHRLLVHDRRLLEAKVSNRRGAAEQMEYADNESLFDPVATPQASYSLAGRILKQHSFDPVQEYTADGEGYYLVRSTGPCRTHKATVRYTYTIRKSDLAIVRITSALLPLTTRAPEAAWVNVYYNRMAIDADSSAWIYDLREGRLTLTHYFNQKTYRLLSQGRGHDGESQRWQHSKDWTLTDLSLTAPALPTSDTIAVRPQSLAGAFGSSDFSADFWGHYNTVPIDTLPLRLLTDKLKTR